MTWTAPAYDYFLKTSHLVYLTQLEPALGKQGFQLLFAALPPIVKHHHGQVIHIDRSIDDVFSRPRWHALKQTTPMSVRNVEVAKSTGRERPGQHVAHKTHD